jgi:hypothetical protein
VEFPEEIPNERAVLKQMGEEIAEAWFEAEGESPVLVFRVPRDRFQSADMNRRVTVESLLKAAAVSSNEVVSWRLGGVSHSDSPDVNAGRQAELTKPLPPPNSSHLTIYVQLKPPAQAADHNESCDQEIPLEKWQALEACWKAILGLEASIDTSRLGMDGVRAEMESAFKRMMTVEEKLHAPQSDVVQWNKAKNRIHYALPKLREFIHRATWALAVPERKRLEEVFKNHIEPRNHLPQVDRVREQLEHLQKDRQVLFAQGNAVYQECRGIMAEIQRAVSALQRNAADNARRKRDARNQKGKHI